jgi:perosamine synthetase
MSALTSISIRLKSGTRIVSPPTVSASRPTAPAETSVAALIESLDRLYRGRLGCHGPIPLHEPWFRGNEWTYVKECLDTGWVSSAGAYVERFERDLAKVCGVDHVVATANGTVGLHVALHALGVTAGDLVVCPAISFVATANSVAYCGASPLFIDVDDRLGIDASALELFFTRECEGAGGNLRHIATGRRIGAVIAVHLFGHPADIERVATLCTVRGVPLLEDAAEALGSLYRGRVCGTFGRAGVLSFNGNKILTTGGGGAVITNDAALAHRIKHLTTTARITHGWEYDHDEIGYNYRMPNLNAALGCAQLELLDDFLVRKRRLAVIIADALNGVCGIELLREPEGAKSNFWLNGFLLDRAELRDSVLTQTNERGVQTRPCWRLLADLPMYRSAPVTETGIAKARDRAARLVNIPSSPNLAGDNAE